MTRTEPPQAPCEAIVLAGGKGTRLSPAVPDLPKPLAPVGERPFLDYVIEAFAASGAVSRVTLALGHLSRHVVAHYEANPPALPLAFSIEDAPLGTGGALIHALPQTQGDPVIVCNGDSLVRINFDSLLLQHAETGAGATIALVPAPDAGRYGRVSVEGMRVTDFAEKSAAPGPGLINAGVYVFGRCVLEAFPPGPCSLEQDLLPRLVADGGVCAFLTNGPFLDIGLPESYATARDFIRAWNRSGP